VLDTVFSYLKMLRDNGPSEQIFREIAKIEQLSFDYAEESQVGQAQLGPKGVSFSKAVL
jgi:secreted Zn-dependent insulinase-like peptidase